jgi:hypothetical protein
LSTKICAFMVMFTSLTLCFICSHLNKCPLTVRHLDNLKPCRYKNLMGTTLIFTYFLTLFYMATVWTYTTCHLCIHICNFTILVSNANSKILNGMSHILPGSNKAIWEESMIPRFLPSSKFAMGCEFWLYLDVFVRFIRSSHNKGHNENRKKKKKNEQKHVTRTVT